jgi:hypothetical protein
MSTKPEVKVQAAAVTPAVAPKIKKPAAELSERIKSQLSAAVLRNKITIDDLSDLEQHVRKLAGFLGA